ncbi:UpxY family transcription antiterminator [Flavobacterium paronense]|uniref:UpxY family transcription antiterminator n=1 Tax=Flavobacterium paronense TaxID=1392775 RepID=A0ABV5GAK8_9FLAO|nr:UpxY family transcription antiterminator [Flavobacterium paronense]MDN3676660.1 UpxY family transcription antiterminator [Flavobacterium paronense]
MAWYALYTNPRQEKKVAAKLQQIGFEVYCPLIIQVRQWSDRKKKVEVPLLPSYVFVKVEPKERDKVFQVSGVVRYLYWLGKPALIRDEEIALMQNWLQGTVASFEVNSIQPGDNYEIPSGPFGGKKGIVEKISNTQITIVLEQLGVKITLHK